MKLIMSVILMLGLIIAGVAWLAQVRSIAGATAIISGLTHLRQENNQEMCKEVEALACQQLRSIQESFVPIIWLGGFTTLIGVAGLIVSVRKRKEEPGQPASSDYRATRSV